MFQYYFLLGLRSLRRNPALTALMVLTLAIGVAASISTLTILQVMSGNPIPHKSDRLFVPVMDNAPPEGYTPGAEPRDYQMGYIDVINLLKSGQGTHRTAIFGVSAPVEPARSDIGVFPASGLALTSDFFSMFETPFLHGQGWTEVEDAAGAQVVVLSRALAEKLYGDTNPVGQRMTMMSQQFQIVGVLDKWAPTPRYYRLIGGATFGESEELFVPFSTAIRLQANPQGNMNCTAHHEPGYDGMLASNCTWIQFWFETASGSDREQLQSYIDNYANEQRKLGRMKRNAPNKLYDVPQWLVKMKVVSNDSRLSAWLAFGFLLLCLVNTIGLLLAKFSVRAAEVGIRRALGASRREIFHQFVLESAVVGLAGGVLGLVLALGALALIAMQSKEMAAIAHMDWSMLAFTFLMSVAAAIVAGLLPTWRACQVTPAIQLKSQ